MRLIRTIDDQHKAYTLSTHLTHRGIENQLEVQSNTDWGSPDYGSVKCRIWVVDEDQVEEAMRVADEFESSPDDPRFHNLAIDAATSREAEPMVTFARPPLVAHRQPIGALTMYTLLICTILFLVSTFTEPIVKAIPENLPYTSIAFSPIYKELIYDYPHAFEIIDKMVQTYGLQSLENPETMPQGQVEMIQEYQHTPYWHGLYDKIIKHFKSSEPVVFFDAPMFEKIRQGEVWRLFTPALLHSDLFHLFFNMIWLIVLGRQMEQRLGKMRYLVFILITAMITNTAQYVMSGSNFLGFSGVLCAMLLFIWQRQRYAAWEGYMLQTGTMAFISFFILFMLALQVVSFFLETFGNIHMPLGIANTAHLVGALSGYLLARLNYFSWQHP